VSLRKGICPKGGERGQIVGREKKKKEQGMREIGGHQPCGMQKKPKSNEQ